jgi:cytochrome c556
MIRVSPFIMAAPALAASPLAFINALRAAIGSPCASATLAPFDLEKARKVSATFEDAGTKAPDLFVKAAKAGDDAAADPKMWEDLDDFKARFAKLGVDAKAAGAQVTDLASFKAAFGNIGKNDCGGCHEASASRRAKA